jgi:hypothetical protein
MRAVRDAPVPIEDHQRHRAGIESIVGKRQPRRIGQVKLRQICGGPRARERKLSVGRIDTVDRTRRAALGQKLGERTVAAADVEPAQRSSSTTDARLRAAWA